MNKEFEEHLVRFRKLPMPARVVMSRPRTFIALGFGILAALVLPEAPRLRGCMDVGPPGGEGTGGAGASGREVDRVDGHCAPATAPSREGLFADLTGLVFP